MLYLVVSKKNYRTDRLSKEEARKLISKIVLEGKNNYVIFTTHALNQLEERDLLTTDILNIVKSADSKIHDGGEFENGSYRYRLETRTILVVISFHPKGERIIIVTSWRKK